MTRAVFDQMLIEYAAEQGATVYQKTPVKQVLFDGDRAIGVEAQMQDGSLQQFHAKVVIDATGLQVYGAGEWRVWKHRGSRRRTWRKLHLGVDVMIKKIVAVAGTESRVHDSQQLPDERVRKATTAVFGAKPAADQNGDGKDRHLRR